LTQHHKPKPLSAVLPLEGASAFPVPTKNTQKNNVLLFVLLKSHIFAIALRK